MTNQVVETPGDFIAAVWRRFGPITFDLAATKDNAITTGGAHFGPGSRHGEDSMVSDWAIPGLLWLNPPFSDRKYPIGRWAGKCADERKRIGAHIAFLCPAAVCTRWFREHVSPHAYVFELYPRVFAKEIRDCALAMYEPAGYLGREPWRWR